MAYSSVMRAIAGVDGPLGVIDLAALDRNIAALRRRAGGLPIRVATKSVRVPAVLDRVLAADGYRGLLAFSLPEALDLHRRGFRDILVAYPTVHRGALRALATDADALSHITLVVDSTTGVDLVLAALRDHAPGSRPPVRLCIEVDASFRPAPASPAVACTWERAAARSGDPPRRSPSSSRSRPARAVGSSASCPTRARSPGSATPVPIPAPSSCGPCAACPSRSWPSAGPASSPISAPEVFDLARLSVGVLGVITEVELACVPAFDLVAHERSESLDALLETFVDRSRTADHLEFYWFPHTDRALVKTNVRVAPGAAAPAGMPAAGPRGRLARLVSEEILDNGGLRAISELGHRIPSLVPALNRLAAAATSNRLYRAPAHEVFVSPRRVRFTEMEYAVPLAAGPEALARIRALIERRRWRISFPIEVRTAAADDVPLSTAYGRESMYIACHRFHRDPFEDCFRRIVEILLELGGRPHWGKLHTLETAGLSERYPRFEDFRALRARLDPEAVFGSAYTDALFAPGR